MTILSIKQPQQSKAQCECTIVDPIMYNTGLQQSYKQHGDVMTPEWITFFTFHRERFNPFVECSYAESSTMITVQQHASNPWEGWLCFDQNT
mmetsp:Transcript_26972/g.56600  ORF Transcript_26972/g.56600 Transcript_26972/m.56600 type:complete len:92 (-) Transcript_26972:648-923(-)